jgi:hypothetical protein
MFTLNKRVALAMAEELGFQAHFVLQPVGGYRNAFTTNPDGTPRMDRAALWHELERHTVRGPHDHSFTGILEHYRGDAFVDALHYTAGVHRLIAERLYPIVAPAVMAAATR